MESIPGFDIQISIHDFKKQVLNLGCALIGQTSEICPADKKMYALRDVTGTVESLGLICGSILSKKIAEGIRGLVMDVKCGSGAFMKDLESARELAHWLSETAALNGVKTTAYITQMNQPLGCFIGNAIEVLECISLFYKRPVLGFEPSAFADTRELSLILSAEMLALSGKVDNFDKGYKMAQECLDSGNAARFFEKLVSAQKGRLAEFQFDESQNWESVLCSEDGFIEHFDAEAIGYAAIALGAGRKKSSDKIDHQAGIICHKKIGDPVKKSERLFSFTARSSEQNNNANQLLTMGHKISLQKVATPSLILDCIK
jgi:pyrimidine-nucleoside phosphorylase